MSDLRRTLAGRVPAHFILPGAGIPLQQSFGMKRVPMRLVSRLLICAQIKVWMTLAEICPGKVGPRVILQLIARQSIQQMANRSEPDVGKAVGAGVTINAIAASLNAPFETVRRNVNKFVADGFCQIIDGRCVLLAKPHRATLVQSFLQSLADEAAALIDQFHLANALPLGRDAVAGAAIEDLAAAMLDISLIAIENNQTEFANWYNMILTGGLFYLNVRNVIQDADLSAAFRDGVIDDAMRSPVSCADLSQFMGLPYHTVRRQLQLGVQQGIFEQSASGYITPASFIASPLMLEKGDRSARYAVNRLRRVVTTAASR